MVAASILRWLLGAFGILIAVFLVLAAANLVLVFAASPGRCNPGGGTVSIGATNATAFQSKWDQYNQALNSGPASVTFNESEITSRAEQYLEDNDSPVKDILICLHTGFGEASGSLDTPLGINADVRIKGNLDLTGDHPKANIDKIQVGGIPEFLTDSVKGFLEDLIESQLDDINLKHDHTATLGEGSAQLNGIP